MADDGHGSEQNPPLGDSRPESRVNPLPVQRPTWGEHIGSINMSQPQNSVNSPADGGTVVIVTVNRSDGDAPTTSSQHDDFTRHIPSLSTSNQDSDNLTEFATTARADHKIYSDQLLTKERGYPLWVPGPGMQLPIEYRRRGTSIGDVGIITSTGEFDFLFNIFHPADHPVNRGVVPQDFSPLSLEELGNDIQQSIVYGPGTYLASSSVRKTSSNWIGKVLFFGGETAIGQRFESSAREAAILIMPNGAASQNLLNTWPVRQAIIRDARAWYRYARYTRGRNIKDGDIRIVVGFDKVTSWGIATSGCNTDQTASFMLKHDSTHLYRWDCIGGSGRVGPYRLEIQDLVEDNAVPQNQCVFVRTLNFTVAGEIWEDLPSEAAQKPYQGSGHRGSHTSNGAPKGGAGSSGGSGASGHQAGSMPGSLHYNQTVKFDPVELGANHPSAALHNLLHEKFPDASMVITEDMDWISVLKDVDVGFPEPEDLCERILKAHELQYHQGVVQIIRKDRPIQSVSMNLGTSSVPMLAGNDEDVDALETTSSAGDSSIDKSQSKTYTPVVTPFSLDDPKSGLFWHKIGLDCLERHRIFGGLDDVQRATEAIRKGIALTPDGHSGLPCLLNDLGDSYQCLFKQSGNLDDISEAIKYQQLGIQLTPVETFQHPSLPSRLTNLGTSFLYRFESSRSPDDISEAINNMQRAIQVTPNGDTELPGRLNNLGNSFFRRFERNGDVGDVTEAINNQQHSVKLTSYEDPSLPSYLSNLGTSFMSRFQRNGHMVDISEAIENQQRAILLTPDGHTDLPTRFNNLGISFLSRFERTGHLDDLSEAIKNQQRAVQLAPDGHSDLPGSRRFDCSRSVDDISEAIGILHRAVRLTPIGHTILPDVLTNLGLAFLYRFRQTKNLDDISEAIKYLQRAVKLTPECHAKLSGRLGNLGISLSLRFERYGDSEDIAEAIKNQQHSIQMTPIGHAALPARLSSLGASCLLRFERIGDLESLKEALSNYRLSATSVTGSPSVRLQAARQWLRLSRKSSSELLDAHACIIRLLSLMSGLENTVKRRHEYIIDSSRLSIAASAAALSFHRPEKALEWLVEGRYIVWNQINELRTPVDELRVNHQALADRFSAVSRELENAWSRSEPHTSLLLSDSSLESQAGEHIYLAKERDQLLVTIRAIRGFEDFLQPKQCADIMRGLPDEGTVVIINAHKDRIDALALVAGASDPLHIPLPKFSYQEANRLAKRLNVYGIADVLEILWSQVVFPILNGLGFSVPDTTSGAKMPRLWWCLTGPLAFLPIHAAGIYGGIYVEGMPRKCLSDFAVSSYIPTVNALLKISASNSVKNHTDAANGLLIVSQPNTPTKSPIRYVVEEAGRISQQLGKGQIPLSMLCDDHATVDNVLKAMESFSSIHLACHISQNTSSPLKSSIRLHDGLLEFSDIMKKNLPNSDFAFLSACQGSTDDKPEDLPEEVVHFAAGMLGAGYRSIVGVMWPIADKYYLDMAELFYKSLLEDGKSKIDGAGAAQALHCATRRFREANPGALLESASYIHIGI